MVFLDRGGVIQRLRSCRNITAVVIHHEGGGDFGLFDSPLCMRFVTAEHVILE